MAIAKGTRHSQVIGTFGERLVCNFLSRSGFEVAFVDQAGMDIVAYNRASKLRIGITVKSRTRYAGTEGESVNLFSHQKGKDDQEKLVNTCEAFAADPWIAVYVETEETADLYLTRLKNYESKYRSKRSRAVDDWKMTEAHKKQYRSDRNVKHVRFKFHPRHWWDMVDAGASGLPSPRGA